MKWTLQILADSHLQMKTTIYTNAYGGSEVFSCKDRRIGRLLVMASPRTAAKWDRYATRYTLDLLILLSEVLFQSLVLLI